MKTTIQWLGGQGLLHGRQMRDGWDRFWFSPADVATVGAMRIATGLVLLYVYGSVAPDVLSYLGPNAWVDTAVLDQLRHAGEGFTPPWWGQSIWFHVVSQFGVAVVYAAFLLAIVCFTVGFCTRAANFAVWVGHLSFVHRAFLSWSGMDTILAMLTLYLLLAPSGAAFSLDRRRARTAPPQESWAANLSLRLIQLHVCIVYLCAGLSKLQGNRWWDGTAVWSTMALYEFAPVDFTRLGYLGDDFCLLVSNLGVLLTLGFEIGFAFLIWNPRLRPILLGLAVLLHAGIGLFMGMGAFGAVMLTGCLAFVDGGQIRWFASRVERRIAIGHLPVATTRKAKRAA